MCASKTIDVDIRVSVEDGYVGDEKVSDYRVCGTVISITRGANYDRDHYDALYTVRLDDGRVYDYDLHSIFDMSIIEN